MTTNSGGRRHEESVCWFSLPTGEGSSVSESELPELLRHLRQRLDDIRADSVSRAGNRSGPCDLALTVVAEALAIGEAMSRISAEAADSETDHRHSPAIYAEIDSRYVEHRTRALRSALHGVDDYVWWGGLVTAAG